MEPHSKPNQPPACPAADLLKIMSGKWRPEIFRLALDGPLRFSSLLKILEKSNKQSIALALKELEHEGILQKNVIKLKPLHIEYSLSDKGKSLTDFFMQLEAI
jgi:DNA-binding HxlR family transcriptional regulator